MRLVLDILYETEADIGMTKSFLLIVSRADDELLRSKIKGLTDVTKAVVWFC